MEGIPSLIQITSALEEGSCHGRMLQWQPQHRCGELRPMYGKVFPGMEN